MGSSFLSEEWKAFNQRASVPAPPATIEEYQTVKTQRGAAGQELLKRDAFRQLVHQVKVEDTKISLPEVAGHNYPLRIYKPATESSEKLPVILYFHGGYWCGGDANSEDLRCRAIIARGSKVIILSFSYRTVSDVPWHKMLSDAEYAMKWSSSNAGQFGGDVSRGFIVSGAEAGAHLAAMCTIRARDKYPDIHLTGQVLIVPTLIAWPDPQIPKEWADELVSHVKQKDAPVMNEALFEELVKALNIPELEQRKGENFPMWASHQELPPAYLAMDECDPTRDHGFLYEALLSQAGVRTRFDYYPGLPNMFVQFPELPTTAVAGFRLSAGVKWLLNPGPRRTSTRA